MSKPIKHPIDQYVIDKVKEMRTARGISQQQLAHLLNLSPGFIGKIEGHLYHQKYSLEQINDLALIFGCSPKDFLPEKGFKQLNWENTTIPKKKK